MNIQDLGAIGELIGSIAILVTLIYLAIQTRLNRKALVDAALNELINSFSSVNQSVIQSKEIALFYEKGLRDPTALSKDEALRFFMMIRESMNGFFNLYLHYQSGAINRQTWEGTAFEVFACCPGVIAFMKTQQSSYTPEFRSYFDSIDKNKYDDPVISMVGGEFEVA